jgi:hypothetical protein
MADDFDDDEIEESVDPVELDAAKKELERRCKEANIAITESEPFEDEQISLEVGFPSGREKRWIYLYDLDGIKRLLDIPFEKYFFIGGYNAIGSYSDNEIEAAIRPLGPVGTNALKRLFSKELTESDVNDMDFQISLDPITVGPTITIGPSSDNFRRLIRGPINRITMKLTKAGVGQHDQAISFLERVSNSLFFQIDLLSNVSLGLSRIRQRPTKGLRRKRSGITEELQYPTTEYDEAPVSLYWYAKSAVGMPLLQFLAFYQVVEFYFPTYYQAEVHRKIRTILKDPTFRSDRDADLGKILGAIQVGRSGGLGDERAQLKATLMECASEDSLRDFLVADDTRKAFFMSKPKGLTNHKLSLASSTTDLRSEVANRLYDIRCKIVHTKSDSKDGEVELLLPFSKEAELLYYDIELIQFLSQKVLIAASTPLQF